MLFESPLLILFKKYSINLIQNTFTQFPVSLCVSERPSSRGSRKDKVAVASSRFRTPLCPRRSLRLQRRGRERVSGEILPFLPISGNDGDLALGLQGLMVARMLLPWGIPLCWFKLPPGCTGFHVFAFAKPQEELLVTPQL